MTKMRVADYIINYLKKYGVEYIFLVVGGGAMYLDDAIKKSGIKYVCFHHEQACAFAAEGYARTSGKLAVICVTSGGGATNAITGILSAWTDSVPVLVLSGQVKLETCMASYPNLKLRQLGDQECDIVSIVKPITKYAKLIMNKEEVKTELEKAVKVATSDRPGE
jgi:Thiamine pyrophosphate-requiring enzymes [acetolactate synthase, pyruvate dehydrogenase (cytochrome), glyoxylate carboligase, phosphonopyruvate decarboxylase]